MTAHEEEQRRSSEITSRSVGLLYKWYVRNHRTYSDEIADLVEATKRNLSIDWNIAVPEARVRE